MATLQHPTLTSMPSFNGSNCKIQNESPNFENNTMLIPMPGKAESGTTASAQAQHTAIFGPVRTITINGFFVGTATQIEAFLQEIDDWQNDGNPVAKKYVNSFGKEYEGTFLPFSFKHNYTTDATLLVDFTLVIAEGQRITGG